MHKIQPLLMAAGFSCFPLIFAGSGFGVLAVVTGMADMISSAAACRLWFAASPRTAFLAAFMVMLAGVVLMLHMAGKRAT